MAEQGEREPAVARILDANLDRAREGLRIIEDWCRFGRDDRELADECKQMRQTLAGWHADELRAARDTPADVGTTLSQPGEQQRSDVPAILQANFARVQEALRVLEEYGKLYQPALSAACERMRYRTYALEARLLAGQRHWQLQAASLYLVTAPQDGLFETVEAALQGGLSLVQYRDKEADDAVRLARAQQLRELCHAYDALLLVNDRVDLALAAGADGVHLGQQDLPIAAARQLLGRQRIIGRSTTNPEELQQAIAEGADYVGVGPVNETPTKAGKTAAGLDYVRYAAEHATIPWFAIGGIGTENLDEVMAANAQRVAVVRAIMEARDPTLVVQYVRSQLARAHNLRRLASPSPYG